MKQITNKVGQRIFDILQSDLANYANKAKFAGKSIFGPVYPFAGESLQLEIRIKDKGQESMTGKYYFLHYIAKGKAYMTSGSPFLYDIKRDFFWNFELRKTGLKPIE